MGVLTKIEWCHHTWNPWRGCDKVSEGCANCYAERGSKRNPAVLGTWGSDGVRAIASEAYWKLPYKWDRESRAAGERRRVFTLSLGDWLELRDDLCRPRLRLFETIEATPNLDWLLLTKRPENWADALLQLGGIADPWLGGNPPENVWIGTSAENHRWLIERSEFLRDIPAKVRFISAEPLIGDLLAPSLRGPELGRALNGIHWLILGGESGAEDRIRPCDIRWIRRAVRECRLFGVAPYVKQLGSWVEASYHESADALDEFPGEPRLSQGKLFASHARVHLNDPKGGDPTEWPEDLRIREFPL